MTKEENITKILLLGETGVGKSTLGNYIIGKDQFLTNGGGNRKTTEIAGEISERKEYRDIYVIDTPGTQDTKLEDSKFLEELKMNFNHKNAGIRAICILINFSQPRFMSYVQQQMHIYCQLFPIETFWEHVAIVFSKAYYYTPEEDLNSRKEELESKNGLISLILQFINERTKKINECKKREDPDFKEIRIPEKLPVFYVDSNLNVEDDKNTRTNNEIEKLIEWARKKDYIDFQNINKNNIDVNYLSSERLEDLILHSEKFINENSKLKIYSKNHFAQYKKETYHNEIVIIKDSKPYIIEEIKEEEIVGPKLLISSVENYNLFNVEHKAVKKKIRTIKNDIVKDWENYDKSDPEGERILFIDKYEEKITFEKKETSGGRTEYDRNDIKDKNIKNFLDKTNIKINNYIKTTKFYKNGKEEKEKETKQVLYKETITSKIIKDCTTDKIYDGKKKIKTCYDIYKENIEIQYDNGKKKEKKENEILKIPRYFKEIEIKGEETSEKKGYFTFKYLNIYKREDEIDEKGDIIKKGEIRFLRKDPNGCEEERHQTGVYTITDYEYFEDIEKENINNNLQKYGIQQTNENIVKGMKSLTQCGPVGIISGLLIGGGLMGLNSYMGYNLPNYKVRKIKKRRQITKLYYEYNDKSHDENPFSISKGNEEIVGYGEWVYIK